MDGLRRRSSRAILAGGALLSVWILSLGRRDYPNLHTILDTGSFLLVALLGWAFWNLGKVGGRGLPPWLGATFFVTALLEGIHVLVIVEWSGVLAPIRSEASVVRPTTWLPASYMLPTGIIAGLVSFPKVGRDAQRLAFGLLALSAVLLSWLGTAPPYSQPGWLGITRPALAGVPVAWAVAGWLCWRERKTERALASLLPTAVLLALAHSTMLYSQAPHDAPAIVAHLGKVTGYLIALLAAAGMGLTDSRERLRAEQELSDLNRDLEQRVLDRTAQLQMANEFLEVANRALTMFSQCNEALARAEAEDSLLDRICQITVDVGGYRSARVAYLLDDEQRSIVIAARAGETFEFRDALRTFWFSARDRADSRWEATEAGEVCVIEKLAQEPALYHIADQIEAAGVGGCILLPIRSPARVIGILSLYSSIGEVIADDERKLLQDLASDLAFGIGALRARAERKKAEVALVASLAEKEALLKEVHHRVKNNMQVIVSLLRLESKRVDSLAVRGVLGDLQNRIMAMALLHESLYRSGNFARVDLAHYLQQLSKQLGRAVASRTGAIAFQLDLVSALIGLDQAIPCGLIVNELVSNSLKHAFPAGRPGVVKITLGGTDSGTLKLRVSDDGVDLPPDFDVRRQKSLGLQLVADLTRQLGGTLEIEPGAAFVVTFQSTAPVA